MGEAFLVAAMCTMALLGLSMHPPMVAAQATPQIFVTPQTLPEQTINQTFTMTVNLTNFPDLAGYQVVFKYNATVLNLTGVAFPSGYVFSSETIVQTLPPPLEAEIADSQDGLNWTMAGASLVGFNNVAVSNGILLEISFTVIGTGETTIILCTASNPVLFLQWGGPPGTFYTSLLDVNGNEYATFTTISLSIRCGQSYSPPVASFTSVATFPSGGNGTYLVLHAFPGGANIVAAQTCWLSEPTLFNASTSYAPTGNITAYIWDFGDGNTTVVNATEPDAWLIVHVYHAAGALFANLTVLSSTQTGANSSVVLSGTQTEVMLVGMALPLYDWTPFLTAILVIIVIAIVAAGVRSAVRHERRRRKLKTEARLKAAPTGQSSTTAKPT